MMAVFVTVLVSAMGISLLSVSQFEVRSSQANLRVKAAFFLAEGGEEDGRMALFNAYRDLTFTDALENYAGVDDTIDFDPTALQFTYDFNGNLSGIGGFGDDVPLVPLVAKGDGRYAAFLTNDPVEGALRTATIES